MTVLKYNHLISSRSNKHSPLRPSLLSAVSVLEQNTRSGTAMTTGEWGRALTPIAYVLGTRGSAGEKGREGLKDVRKMMFITKCRGTWCSEIREGKKQPIKNACNHTHIGTQTKIAYLLTIDSQSFSITIKWP
jgi:hypothetical protein